MNETWNSFSWFLFYFSFWLAYYLTGPIGPAGVATCRSWGGFLLINWFEIKNCIYNLDNNNYEKYACEGWMKGRSFFFQSLGIRIFKLCSLLFLAKNFWYTVKKPKLSLRYNLTIEFIHTSETQIFRFIVLSPE